MARGKQTARYQVGRLPNKPACTPRPHIQPTRSTLVAGTRRNPEREARADMSFLFDSEDDIAAIDNERPKKKRRVAWKPKGKFRFLDLPAELRNSIYELLLVNQRDDSPFHALRLFINQEARDFRKTRRERESIKRIHMGGTAIIPKPVKVKPLAYTAILATNKQINREAKHVLYSRNIYALTLSRHNWDHIHQPTNIIKPSGWDFSAMTNLHLELVLSTTFDVDTLVDWMALFSEMASLNQLTISLTRGPNHYVNEDAMQKWEDVHWMFKAFLRSFVQAIPKNATVVWDHSEPAVGEGRLRGQGHRRVKPSVVKGMWAEMKQLQGLEHELPEAVEEDTSEDTARDNEVGA
ncbi:uncharacterized protein BDZ99DRAFT_460131 [Mytilinidion resinicola]|uniref:F-box domain-containing protein n=1 Tax=Mytilinidion resinicola TaxID=574789 RepID=A0A6A6Z0E2_9PEZI|nr:uncharacterized protein BDZ99DRAFT_460131 [Mytilinidion resinicola]KAF2814480.1 hypothetical protein BDZ99DRAFT_460131 [Mytilinidion resinicola]